MAELQHSTTSVDVLAQPSTINKTLEVGVDVQEAYDRGYVDINFFAGLALPLVATHALPYFYIACFQLIAHRNPNNVGAILRFALGLPRGHAKTTFVKILLAWLIAYDKVKFILIVCATEPNAQNILEDLSNIMGSNNMEAVYGQWTNNLCTDNKESKKCIYHNRVITLDAKGAQSALRGINKDNARPDCILLDDAQTKENDKSPTESASLLTWFVATLLKVIAPEGDRLIIYIGNMYSENCILKKLQDSPSWISLVTGAILDNGEPLWPELHSLASLMESYLHDESLGQADEWFAEVMNDPRRIGTSLLNDTLPSYPGTIGEFDGIFITIDPAGYRKNSDDNVVVTHGIHSGKGFIIKSDAGKFTPEETIKIALGRALEYGATVIGVETVGYQQSLKFWLEFFISELDITGIEIVELKPHGRSKESRIIAFIQELMAGNYYHLTPEERALFVWQAMQYKIGRKENKDDLLDAEAYGIDMRTDYWHLIGNNKQLRLQHSDARVVSNNTPF